MFLRGDLALIGLLLSGVFMGLILGLRELPAVEGLPDLARGEDLAVLGLLLGLLGLGGVMP